MSSILVPNSNLCCCFFLFSICDYRHSGNVTSRHGECQRKFGPLVGMTYDFQPSWGNDVWFSAQLCGKSVHLWEWSMTFGLLVGIGPVVEIGLFVGTGPVVSLTCMFMFSDGWILNVTQDAFGLASNPDVFNTSSARFEDVQKRICNAVLWFLYQSAKSWQNLFMPYANNKCADQPAHQRSLIVWSTNLLFVASLLK